MRLLVKQGADPRIVHRSEYVTGEGFRHRTEMTTAVMAALGMGGGKAWVQPPRGEHESLTLAAVKLAAEFGADLNAANTDGRTAADAARAQGLESVIHFLAGHGANAGVPPSR